MPLDRETFLDPVTYLRRGLRSPLVKLDSRRIVQRHANALLLAHWLRKASGQPTRLKVGDFLGFPQGLTLPEAEDPPVAQFTAWLGLPGTAADMTAALAALTRGTALEGSERIPYEAASAFEEARTFCREWRALPAQAATLEPGIPGLLGLRANYIISQLGAWRYGTRTAAAPDCMQVVAGYLTEADGTALGRLPFFAGHSNGPGAAAASGVGNAARLRQRTEMRGYGKTSVHLRRRLVASAVAVCVLVPSALTGARRGRRGRKPGAVPGQGG